MKSRRFGCVYEDYVNEVIKINYIAKKIVLIVLATLLMTCTAAGDEAEIDPDADANVTITAPEYVSEDTFEVTIDVTEVNGLNSGQFNLIHNPDVLKVQSVEDGNID
ncbi:MAG: cohesin domain-containing protein, partial [Euryarchaeota archaeon]|nr:cohesin domain-containing protein [Euryarchaeota archaeon]